LRDRGKQTGLISNWDVRLGLLLEEMDLDRFLDPLVISCQVGVAKPQPGIFRAALQRSGQPAHRALHVGDSYREDVVGARRVGIQAVLVRREGDCAPLPGVRTIGDLREVLDLVD
jgi:putative hydrolase of the HAD superfamily